MSVFSPEDVEEMASGGNSSHNALYMARWTPKEFPIPNGTDITKLRDFIRYKYVDKRWYSNGSSSSSGAFNGESRGSSHDGFGTTSAFGGGGTMKVTLPGTLAQPKKVRSMTTSFTHTVPWIH